MLATKGFVQSGLDGEAIITVHIQALVSADVILLGISNNNEHFIINSTSVPGRQLVNSPTAQSLKRCLLC